MPLPRVQSERGGTARGCAARDRRLAATSCVDGCRGLLVEPATRVRSTSSGEHMKRPPRGWPFHMLVEAAGIEPASASPTSQVLHAYPSLLFSPLATRRAGKTNSQSSYDLSARALDTPLRELVKSPPEQTHKQEQLRR